MEFMSVCTHVMHHSTLTLNRRFITDEKQLWGSSFMPAKEGQEQLGPSSEQLGEMILREERQNLPADYNCLRWMLLESVDVRWTGQHRLTSECYRFLNFWHIEGHFRPGLEF